MSWRGFSHFILIFIGPRGDSAVSLEKDMCPAYATCLFRQKFMVFPLSPSNRAFLAALRMRSLRSRFCSFVRDSIPFACAVSIAPLHIG